MKRVRMPSPAMLVAVIAVVLALGGTSFAATKLLGLGAFKEGVKDKTVGVGKLRYVTSTVTDDNTPPTPPVVATATCPSGYEAIGGGIKASAPDVDTVVDSYPTASGWTGHVSGGGATESTFTITAVCARSRAITGTPPTG